MGNYGLKVSQQGYDVKTATDTQLVFSSKFGTWTSMCLVAVGTTTQTGSNETLSKVIAHGQSFIPYVLIFYKTSTDPTVWKCAPGVGGAFLSVDYSAVNTIRIDDTNITLYSYFGDSNVTITIKYYIFNVSI